MNRLSYFLFFFFYLFACQHMKPVKSSGFPTTQSAYQTHLQELISLSQIEHLDIQSNHLYEAIAVPLQIIKSPATLKKYYYECEEAKAGSEAQSAAFRVYFSAQEAILFQLADLGNEASAKCLVSIYADLNLSFDANQQLNLGEALVLCGPVVVPHLTKVKETRPIVSSRVLECIANGRSFL